MQTPIDFGKEFLNRFFDRKDADACLEMLAGDLVWITPEDMHHFLSEGAVLKFLRKSIGEDGESRYVDLISIKSSPSADNIMTVAYEVNLVSREDERPLYLRCSMAICRRSRRLEITFLHFSRKQDRDSSERLRGFISNLPCGVMILACLDGQREEAVFYNDYFARRLRYSQEEFARAMEQNPFFMASEEDREEIREQIGQARRTGGNIAVNLRFFRRDGNSFYYRMIGAPAYEADGGTVYYCVFQEITGLRLANERLQNRLDTAACLLRQLPGAVCGIEYPPQAEEAAAPGGEGGNTGDEDVRVYHKKSAKKTGRVFFTSKKIPAMFGVSNSAYVKNILLDPFYGLEITSITREKLLGTQVFGGAKGASAGPVSCGIFRLKKSPGIGAGRVEPQSEKRQEEILSVAAAAAEGGTDAKSGAGSAEAAGARGAEAAGTKSAEAAGTKSAEAAGTKSAEAAGARGAEAAGTRSVAAAGIKSAADSGAGTAAGQERHRVELIARRVREKDGTVRLYLFYYDREAEQQEAERRVDRAMKMGRAGQDQLRAELRRLKEGAARRQSEMQVTIQTAQEKYEAEITRVENRLREEKNRTVLLARQLEESRAANRQMADTLEKTREDASRRIRIQQAEAERKTGEAAAARDLLEEQLREAQERGRVLERQLRNERIRRFLMEEQLREGGSSGTAMPAEAPETGPGAGQILPEKQPDDTGQILPEKRPDGAGRILPEGRMNAAGQILPEDRENGSGAQNPLIPGAGGTGSMGTGKSQGGDHGVDWMAASGSLTVFSAMDPVSPGSGGPAAVSVGGGVSSGLAYPVKVIPPHPAVKAAFEPEQAAASAQAEQAAVSAQAEKAAVFAQTEISAAFAQAGKTAASAQAGKTAASVQAENSAGSLRRTVSADELLREEELPGERTAGERAFLAEKQVRAREQEKAKRRVRRLMRQTDRIGEGAEEILNDFLEAACPEQVLLQERFFSPESCLENVLRYEDLECTEKMITLRLYKDSRLPDRVRGFGALLTRALCELLENAVEATPNGGIIRVHCRADRPSDGFVNLYYRIDDSGKGIPPARMQTIFEAERGNDPDVPVHSGLFAAKEAATLMGGSVHARSGPDGSRFTLSVALRLPESTSAG